jgi:hypothetical protein
MMQEWEDRPDWEGEVRMRKWLRSQEGPTPYSEVRTWRRRFYAVFALLLFSLFVLALIIGGCRF